MLAAVSLIDWTIVVLSVVLVAVAGAYFARRQKSTEQYFVGGRSVPGWAAGLSLFASIISTITFLAYPEQGFAGDWTLMVPNFTLPLVIAFVCLTVLPFYRRYVRMSAYEYLERRFGYPARAYAALQFLLINVFRLSLVLLLSAKAIHTFTGWDTRQVILACGVITIVYTVLGGFEAVVWTDVLQSLILLSGGAVCVLILLFMPENGPLEILRTASQDSKFHMLDFSWDLQRPTFIVLVLYGIFGYSSLYVTNQDSVQRYLATPSERQATRGLWVGAVCCIATWSLFCLIGTLLYSYYKLHPGRLPAEIAAEKIKVFPYFVMSHFPKGAIGLVLAAMLAASMSTLSSLMNSMSLVTVCDFVGRVAHMTSDRRRLVTGKIVTCLWGTIGTLVALAMIGVERALQFTYDCTSILSGGLLGLFMLAFLVRRASAAGIYAGLAAGVLITAWGAMNQFARLGIPIPEAIWALRPPFHPWLVIACSNVGSFAVGLVVSLLAPADPQHRWTSLTLWDLRSGDVEREDLTGGEREGGAVPVGSELRK